MPLVLLAAAVLAVVGQAGVANAATIDGPTQSGTHCAVGVTATAPGAEATAAPQVECFDSDAAVWKFVTGAPLPAGTTSLADAVKLQSALPPTSARTLSATVAAAATGYVVLAVVYTDANYGGTSLTLFGTSATNLCPSGSTYGFANLGSYGFNDVISSVSGNNCQVQLYQNINYGGSTLKCNGNCASVGSLNDQASSIVLRKLYS